MQNAKIFKGVNLEQIKAEIERNCEIPLAGDFAYATSTDTYYKFSNLTGKWEYLVDGLGSTIPMVSFGTSLPQTNAAAALATIVDPTKTPIVVVRDADKNEVVLHVYTPTGWVAHRDNVGTINHFDFTTFATKQDATAALPNKNPNDLIYVSGDKTLYYVDSNKQLVPVVTVDTTNFVTKPTVGDLQTLLTTNKGSIVSALNELFNTGSQLNADIQSKLKHLTSAEHIVEYNTGNPSDPVTTTAALATITNPAEGDKALLIDKTAAKSRLEIYHNGAWLMLTDDVGGNVDLTNYQTITQADSKYATKTALAGKQDDVGFRLADIDGNSNDDVYNKMGHKLMLTDASGQIIPIVHEGQAIPKKTLDDALWEDTTVTTNEGDIDQAANVPALTDANVGKFFTYYGPPQMDTLLFTGYRYLIVNKPKLAYKEMPLGVDLTAGKDLRKYNYIPTTDGNFTYEHSKTGTEFKVKNETETQEGRLHLNDQSVVLEAGDPAIGGHGINSMLRIGSSDINLKFTNPTATTGLNPTHSKSEIIFQSSARDKTKSEILLRTDITELNSKDHVGLIAPNVFAHDTSGQPFMANSEGAVVTKKYLDTKVFQTDDTNHIVWNSGQNRSTHTVEELMKALDTLLTSVPGADMNAKLLKIAGVVGAWT